MADTKSIPIPPRAKDLTGLAFGRLTVIAFAGSNRWHCQCECGSQRIVRGVHLRSGHTSSCGCRRKEVLNRTTHGLSGSPEFFVWWEMLRRCYDDSREQYERYGGRGITVCQLWRNSFSAFYSDMGPRPSPQHSIERIDNDRGYSKANCRWATVHEQCRNTRRTRNLTFRGVTMCLTDWAARIGISQPTLTKRLERGWSIERALTTPTKHITTPRHQG